MNKALVLISSLIIFLAIPTTVLAADKSLPMNWWDQWNIWKAIQGINSEMGDIWDNMQSIQEDVKELQDRRDFQCWDLNQNGRCDKKRGDKNEDKNGDLICNASDCPDNGGSNGKDGLSSLVKVTDEPEGANCPNGGKKIEAGLDANINLVLDSEEVSSTGYVCNGGNGGYGQFPDFSGWDQNAADDFQCSNVAACNPDLDTNRNDDFACSNLTACYTNLDTDKTDDFSGNYGDLANKPDFAGWDTNAANDFQCLNITSCYTNLDDDKTDDQLRVSGTCASGSSIREINSDGSVVCETDDSAAYDDTALTSRVSTLETSDPLDYDTCSDVDSCGYLKPGDETDPQVGALTADKWCKSDGSQINCEENPPQALPSAMIIGGGSDKDVTDGVMYIAAFFGDFSLNESSVDQVLPVAGTLSQLNVRLDANPGTGNSYVFMVRKNGANTTLTCTISGISETNCIDADNQVAFEAGDTIALQSTAIDNPSDRTIRWTAKFQ